MSGAPDSRADAACVEGCVLPPYPVIPWTLGFTPLLAPGFCVHFWVRRLTGEQQS